MSKRGIGDVSSAKQEEMSISTQQELQPLMCQLVIDQLRPELFETDNVRY